MIEQLEARLQYANLSGQVFHDTDNSESFDAGESAYRGWRVFIDANANGQYDAGETSTLTDSKGRYSFDNVPAGTYLLGTVAPSSDYLQTTPGPNGKVQSGVIINVVFAGSVSASVHKAFIDAAARWESILTGVKVKHGIANDTVTIDASVMPIDGVNGILGQAGPTSVSRITGLPDAGIMQFDSADLKQLNTDNQLEDVITHEMGHVLGFGTAWRGKGITIADNSRNPRYIGANGVAAFDQLFKTTDLSIPLENGGLEGTRDSHWDEDTMTQELMTGYISPVGTPNPLSILTVGQFQDLGYTVNYRAADVWDPTTSPETVTKTTPLDFGGVANERSVKVGSTDTVTGLNFGYRVDNPPVINSFTIQPANGGLLTLTAAKVIDYDGDPVQGVSFYRESNGIPGLQKGVGGDTYIAARTTAKRHAFAVQTSIDGLGTGDQVYYAIASDNLGVASRRTGVYTIYGTDVPDRITGLTASRQSDTSATISFTDTQTGLLGYHFQLATSDTFSSQSLVKAFNISADSRSVLIAGLNPGTTYYIQVRGYNNAGAGIYSEPLAFETARTSV